MYPLSWPPLLLRLFSVSYTPMAVVVVGEADIVEGGELPWVVELAPEWACCTGGQGIGRAFIASYRRPVSSMLPLFPLDIFIHEHM